MVHPDKKIRCWLLVTSPSSRTAYGSNAVSPLRTCAFSRWLGRSVRWGPERGETESGWMLLGSRSRVESCWCWPVWNSKGNLLRQLQTRIPALRRPFQCCIYRLNAIIVKLNSKLCLSENISFYLSLSSRPTVRESKGYTDWYYYIWTHRKKGEIGSHRRAVVPAKLIHDNIDCRLPK